MGNMEWYSSWGWVYALIPIVAVVVWGVYMVARTVTRGREADPAAFAAMQTRLDAIDARLAAVEKTINDIP